MFCARHWLTDSYSPSSGFQHGRGAHCAEEREEDETVLAFKELNKIHWWVIKIQRCKCHRGRNKLCRQPVGDSEQLCLKYEEITDRAYSFLVGKGDFSHVTLCILSWFIDDKEKNHSFNKHSIAYLVPEKAGLLSLACINLHINLYILIPSCSHCWSIKMQNSSFYRFCCYKKSVWRYLVPEGWSTKTFYFLANRQGADNCDKTLHSLTPDHCNVTMTKRAAKPPAALRRMEKSLCRSHGVRFSNAPFRCILKPNRADTLGHCAVFCVE